MKKGKNMNSIKKIIITSVVLLQALQMVASASSTSSASSKKAQILSKVQEKAATKKAAAPQAPVSQAPTHPSVPSSPSAHSSVSAEIIEEFIKDVEKITCSCGSKKDKDGHVVKDDLPRCKHDKDHLSKVKKAFESYKKLYEAAVGSGKSISAQDNAKVKPSVEKIFECKNIQHMAWMPKITGQVASKK